jgi:hypothetical protein
LGCATKGTGPQQKYVNPDYDSYRPQSIALCPIKAQGPAANGIDVAEAVIEEVAGERQEYSFVDSRQLLRCVARNEFGDEYEQLLEEAAVNGSVDSTVAYQIRRKCAVDGMMYVELLAWEERAIASNQEGYPESIVELALKLYDLRTGVLLWAATQRHSNKGPYYSPETSLDRRVDSAGIVRSSGAQGTADPPPIRSTAHELVTTMLGDLP